MTIIYLINHSTSKLFNQVCNTNFQHRLRNYQITDNSRGDISIEFDVN